LFVFRSKGPDSFLDVLDAKIGSRMHSVKLQHRICPVVKALPNEVLFAMSDPEPKLWSITPGATAPCEGDELALRGDLTGKLISFGTECFYIPHEGSAVALGIGRAGFGPIEDCMVIGDADVLVRYSYGDVLPGDVNEFIPDFRPSTSAISRLHCLADGDSHPVMIWTFQAVRGTIPPAFVDEPWFADSDSYWGNTRSQVKPIYHGPLGTVPNPAYSEISLDGARIRQILGVLFAFRHAGHVFVVLGSSKTGYAVLANANGPTNTLAELKMEADFSKGADQQWYVTANVLVSVAKHETWSDVYCYVFSSSRTRSADDADRAAG